MTPRDPAAGDTRDGWTVIVPVKPAAIGKSRLDDGTADRESLARAIALDTIEAAASASRVARVVVVTDDEPLRRAVARWERVETVPEGEERGLDAALAAGAAAAGAGVPRAALLGDLPALRADDLDAALAAAETVERALVEDAEGTGSTMVTARAGAVWTTAFGEGSAERHRLLGCTPLDLPAGSSLRRDVDTAEQLRAASVLGLGPRTAALLAGPAR